MTTVPNWHGLIADDKSALLTLGNSFMPRQVVPLINAQAKVAQAVRITLKPLQRDDRQPTHPRMPGTNDVAFDGLRAGFSIQPASGPGGIPFPIMEGNPDDGEGNYVHITWGVGGAKPHELVADWPVTGASIVLTADQVTVEGVCGPQIVIVAPEQGPGSRPRFAADLCPAPSIARSEYDALRFYQFVTSSIVTSPDSVEVAVPEFASSVEVQLGDVLPAASSVDVSWLGPSNQLKGQCRYPAPLPSPLILPVAEGAVALVLTLINAGVFDATLGMLWHIAP